MREHVSLTIPYRICVYVYGMCGRSTVLSTVRLPHAQVQHGGSRVRKVGGRRETEMSDVE